MTRAAKHLLVLSLLFLMACGPSCSAAENQILNIRHWVAPDHTRVVIDAGDDAAFTVDKEARKISINLEDMSVPTHIRPQTWVNKPGLEAITIVPRGETGVRVELSLPAGVQTTVFKLKKFQDMPYRIVIDIVLPEIARQEKEAREKIKVTRKDRVVVIDPGHGGEAVGAVGKGGTMEKDVVLAISKKLRDALNRRPGYRAFLTRDGDYYVSFNKRMAIAREYGADLFISVHADAARNRMASGSSVYCLSTGGASTAAAKILARNENLADIVGGVANGDGADASDPIILNMFQTNTINLSKDFGSNLLDKIKGVNRLKFPTVQEAPFLVLKMPEIPAVLIETAYISNPNEEKLLKSDRFQARIAETLAGSIGECIPPYPPLTVAAAAAKAGGGQERSIKKGGENQAVGETKAPKGEEASQEASLAPMTPPLEEQPAAVRGDEIPPVRQTLAAPVFARTKPDPPVAAKGITDKTAAKTKEPKKEDKVRKTPATVAARTKQEPPPAVKRGETPSVRQQSEVYRVKKGDTLDKIARRQGTSVALLVKLNGIDPRASLYVGRVLKITGTPPVTTIAEQGETGAKATRSGGKRIPAAKPGKGTYRVKKGDNLEVIARKHGTTAQVLAELNRLKPSAPLYVDRKLLLPEDASL